MSEIKLAPDENLCLVINPASKTIAPKYKRQKAIHVAKGDHDSVLIAFEMPRYVNGYDMSAEENSIQIHYANISCEDTTKHSAGFDKAEDITVKDDIVSFCWRVSANATKYAGTLSIGITFERYEEIEEEVREIYSWSTAPYGKIIVCNSMDSTEEAVGSAYSYLIETCNSIVSTMLQEAIDSGKLDGIDGETPYIGENGNWFIGEYDTGVKANWASIIGTIESTLRSHDAFINAEMPHYLGELRALVNNAPKDAGGNIDEMASKESVETMKALFPKDIIGGNPIDLNTLFAFNVMGMPVSLKDILPFDIIGNPVDLKDILPYNRMGSPVDFKSILPTDEYGEPVNLQTLLPKTAPGKYEKVARQYDLDVLKETAEYLEGVALPRIYYDTINDKDFIKSSINYVAGNTSKNTYVCMYENRKEDGSATLSNAPCKSGILFHYQIMTTAIIQTMHGCDGHTYSRVYMVDMGTIGAWTDNDNGEVLEDLDDRVTLLEEDVGNISTALDELHEYAQALIGGEQ